MVKKVMRIEPVRKASVDENRDETDEAQRDMYREPGSSSTDRLDEADPSTPLDDRVELGGDENERASVGEC